VIIAMDIGNSAAKAALVEGSVVFESGRLDTSTATGADLLDGLRVLAGSADAAPRGIVAVSVVDRWTERLERAAEELELSLTMIAGSHIPISTSLIRPDQTGPDRLLAAWAAATIYGTPVIVVDLGTATTVDAVDGDGFFLGGAILPGLALAADALAEGTARLPRVELALPDDALRNWPTNLQITVPPDGSDREKLDSLSRLLSSHPGQQQVELFLKATEKKKTVVMKPEITVTVSQSLLEKIEELFGEGTAQCR
jgi:type III pantothenate kinase